MNCQEAEKMIAETIEQLWAEIDLAPSNIPPDKSRWNIKKKSKKAKPSDLIWTFVSNLGDLRKRKHAR